MTKMRWLDRHLTHAVSFHGFTPTIEKEPLFSERYSLHRKGLHDMGFERVSLLAYRIVFLFLDAHAIAPKMVIIIAMTEALVVSPVLGLVVEE